ncbi:hypothetical protein C4585_01900 [Candidatus Parcubacteria bacterium]|nr:MAG: hypothetical protein C4585_01900 [Candidatus Parcubacteria bacterium]
MQYANLFAYCSSEDAMKRFETQKDLSTHIFIKTFFSVHQCNNENVRRIIVYFTQLRVDVKTREIVTTYGKEKKGKEKGRQEKAPIVLTLEYSRIRRHPTRVASSFIL